MEKFCRQCGAQLKEGAKFCPKCGSLVNRKEINEISKSVEYDSRNGGTFSVKNNNRDYMEDEGLYENTYGDYRDEFDDNDYPEPPKKKKGWLIALIVIAVLLCLGGGGAFAAYKLGLFGSNDEDTSEIADNGEENNDEHDGDQKDDDDPNDKSKVFAEHQMESELTDASEMTIEVYDAKDNEGNEPIGYVDVKTARIRVRKGPSTASKDTSKRTSVGDHYEVYEKTTGEGYNWYRISNNNEWIADNNGKWMTFTAYVHEDPKELELEYVAKQWYKIYLSYLTSINHDGDFSYLANTSEEQLTVFRDNYTAYNKGYNFMNVTFDFDKTDVKIAQTGKNKYQAVCHAYVMNTITDKSTGSSGDNEVKLIAKLEFDTETSIWTLLSQKSDKSYNPGTHEMISCGSN